MLFTIVCVVAAINAASAALDPVCTAPVEGDVQSCCKLPTLTIWEGESSKKCSKQLDGKPLDKLELYSKEIRGFSNCLGTESGAIKNNELQPDVINKMLAESGKTQKEWATILTDAGTYCIGQASANPNPTDIPDDGCSPIGSTLLGCIQTQSFKNCPASLWQASDTCNKVKQAAEKCVVVPMAAF